jgi:hypothetical protein
MSGAVGQPLSIETFRAWRESRPDEEHWELIAGFARLMAPATRDRRRITSNLEWLLSDALETRRSGLTAYQRIGLNLASVAPDYDPEPDVVVVDAGDDDERYSDRFYFVAEIASRSDRETVESKCEIYKRHPDCRCVLVIQQDHIDVEISVLRDAGRARACLTDAADQLVLEEFGLHCRVADLYRGTRLQPRRA